MIHPLGEVVGNAQVLVPAHGDGLRIGREPYDR